MWSGESKIKPEKRLVPKTFCICLDPRRRKSAMAGSCGMFPSLGVGFFGIERNIKSSDSGKFSLNSCKGYSKYGVDKGIVLNYSVP